MPKTVNNDALQTVDNDALLKAQAMLESGESSAAPASKQSSAAPVSKPSSRIMVNFHNHEGEAGASDVFVSVNGTAYTFPREIDVEVPIEVLGAIDNAVITKFSRSSKGEDISRDVKRYPYSKV